MKWTPPATDGGSDITGYNIVERCGYAKAKLANHRPLSAYRYSYLVTHLVNGTRCRFTVKAINAVGVGLASKPATATPHHPATYAPGAPLHLHAQAGEHTVALAWKPPVSNGGSAITGYNILKRCGNGRAVLANPHSLAADRYSYVVTHLVGGTRCRFTVNAINAVGAGPVSKPATVTPHHPINSYRPGPVLDLTAKAGDHAVTLTWTPPVSAGGSAITGYNVYASRQPDTDLGQPINLHPLPASANTAQVTKLTDGRTYYFTVRAIDALGTGAAATPVPVLPYRYPPQLPPPASTTTDATTPAVIPLPPRRNLLLFTV